MSLPILQGQTEELSFANTQELLLSPSLTLSNTIDGDFDGDGDLDTLFHSPTGVVLCENTGDPEAPIVRYLNFPEARVSNGNLLQYQEILKAAPISGEGKDDILVLRDPGTTGVGTTPVLEVFQIVDNSGIVSFRNLYPLFDQLELPPIFVGDFTRQDEAQLEIIDALGINRGAASRTDPTPVLFDGPVDGVTDDNGDDWTDIVSEGIIWLNNGGNGTFTNTGRTFQGSFEEPARESGLVKAPSIGGEGIIAFDADGDGDLDIGYPFDRDIITLTNQGDDSFTWNQNTPLAIDPIDVSLKEAPLESDFNGDGLTDRVEETPRNRDGLTGLTVSLAQADGSFSPPVTLSDEMTRFPHKVLDYDGDGDSDIFFVYQDFFFTGSRETFIPPVFAQIFLNDGSGSFTLEREVQLSDELIEPVNFTGRANLIAADTVQEVRFFDFDGDGILDILTKNLFGFKIFPAQGDPFVTASVYGPNQEFWLLTDLIIADFNGDQRPDLVAQEGGRGALHLILNETGDPSATLPVLSVEADPIDEGAEAYRVTFSLDRPATDFVGANLELESGTAILGEDFSAAPANFIGFSAGEMTTTRYFHVLDDSILEGDESFLLRFSNAVGLRFASETAAFTIVDNEEEPAALILRVTGEAAQEGISEAPLTFTLSEPAPETLTFPLSFIDGTAVEDSDYQVEETSVVFLAGETVSTTQPVTIISDSEEEGEESFFIRFLPHSNDVPVTLRDVPFEVTILGDQPGIDDPVQLTVQADPIPEDAETFLVTFSLNRPATSFVGVNFELESGSAILGQDFAAAASNFVGFSAGETTTTRYFPVLDDAIAEPEESFNIRFSNPIGLVLPSATVPLTIIDNDGPAPAELVVTATVSPASEDNSEIPLILTLNRPAPERITLDVTVEDGTATRNSDYFKVSDFATFAKGETVAASTLARIFDDTEVEGDETFTIRLSSDEVIIAQETIVITIQDNDEEEVGNGLPQLSAVAAPIEEGAETYLVTFSLDHPATSFVGANLELESGSATLGEDFGPAPANFVGFAAGETTANRYFPVFDDNIAEGDETILLRFSNPIDLAFAEDTVSFTIIDDEEPSSSDLVLTVSCGQQRPEGERPDPHQLHPECDPLPNLSECRSELLKMAQPSKDATYAAVAEAVSFAPKVQTVSTSFSPVANFIDDSEVEGDESFVIRLSSDQVSIFHKIPSPSPFRMMISLRTFPFAGEAETCHLILRLEVTANISGAFFADLSLYRTKCGQYSCGRTPLGK